MAEGKELTPAQQQFLLDELRWYGHTIAGGGPMVGFGLVGRRADKHWYEVTLPGLQTLSEVYPDHTTNLERPGFVLGYDKGKQVQEILNRYVGEELMPRTNQWSPLWVDSEDAAEAQKDIDYITGLARLFD